MAMSWSAAFDSQDQSLDRLLARRHVQNQEDIQVARAVEDQRSSQAREANYSERTKAMAEFNKAKADALKQQNAQQLDVLGRIETIAADPDGETKYGKQAYDAARLMRLGIKPSVSLTDKTKDDEETSLVTLDRQGKPKGEPIKYKGKVHFAQQPAPPASISVQMPGQNNDDVIEVLAAEYINTGKVPNTGMGAAGVALKQRVIARVAQKAREAGVPISELSGLSGEMTTKRSAFKKQQESYQMLTGFNDTIKSNLKIARDQVKNLPDTGVPLLNRPIRAGMAAMGNTDVTRARTALVSVGRELARVLEGNPSLAGVMTDSAKAQIHELTNADAMTNEQILSALTILEKDVAGLTAARKSVLDNLQKEVQAGAFAGNAARGEVPASTAATPAPAAAQKKRLKYDPATGELK